VVQDRDRWWAVVNAVIWEDNIKMDLQEVGCGGMDWIEERCIQSFGKET
jgi:hypothetical protein